MICSSVWQHVQLSEQIRPWDTLACCWDVRQPTNRQTPPPLFILWVYFKSARNLCMAHLVSHVLVQPSWCENAEFSHNTKRLAFIFSSVYGRLLSLFSVYLSVFFFCSFSVVVVDDDDDDIVVNDILLMAWFNLS